MNKTQVNLPKSIAPSLNHTMVRVGSEFDGGYIIAAPLLGTTTDILTYGLGMNWDFEREMARIEPKTKIHCYDHTIGRPRLVRKYIEASLRYKTKPLKYASNIVAYKDYVPFFEKNLMHKHFKLCLAASEGLGKVTVKSTLASLGACNDKTFLKCDIEGAEYEIADAIVEYAGAFHGIALEFHDVSMRISEVIEILGALSKTHNIDHIHANNLSKLGHVDKLFIQSRAAMM